MTDVAHMTDTAAAPTTTAACEERLLVQPKIEAFDENDESTAGAFAHLRNDDNDADEDDEFMDLNYGGADDEEENPMHDADDVDFRPAASGKAALRVVGRGAKSTASRRGQGKSKRGGGAKYGLSLFGKRALGKVFKQQQQQDDKTSAAHFDLNNNSVESPTPARSKHARTPRKKKTTASEDQLELGSGHENEYSMDSSDVAAVNSNRPATETYLIDRYKYAVRHIRQGLSVEEACNKYRISKGALLKCLSGGTAPRGKKTRMTEAEEDEVVRWLIGHKTLRYNDAIHLVFERVNQIFERTHRPNPFNNGRPSMDWWYDFLSRHPQIMASKPEWLKRGKVNDQYLKDVQSGKLKCTKFRRALLSAIQYMRSMSDPSSSAAAAAAAAAGVLKQEELDLSETTTTTGGTKSGYGGQKTTRGRRQPAASRKRKLLDNKENEAKQTTTAAAATVAKRSGQSRKDEAELYAAVAARKRSRRSVSTSSSCSIESDSSASSIFSLIWPQTTTTTSTTSVTAGPSEHSKLKSQLEASVLLSNESDDFEQYLSAVLAETVDELCRELDSLDLPKEELEDALAGLVEEITSQKNIDMLLDSIKREDMSGLLGDAGEPEDEDEDKSFGSMARKKYLDVQQVATTSASGKDELSSSSGSLMSPLSAEKLTKKGRSTTNASAAAATAAAASLKSKFGLINDCARLNELTMNMYDYVDYDEDNRMYLVKGEEGKVAVVGGGAVGGDVDDDEEAADEDDDEALEKSDIDVVSDCGGAEGADDKADEEEEEEDEDEEDVDEEDEEDAGPTNITTLHDFV